MRDRQGDYAVTRSGRKFYVCDPAPEQLCIKDIAWALSKVCRYGGHILCDGIYSVAQHSLLVSHLVPIELALCGLLHDAPEFVLGDVIKPLKVHLPDYQKIEHAWELAIAHKFATAFPLPPEIKYADEQMFAVEVRDLRPQIDGVHGSMKPQVEAPTNICLKFDVYEPIIAYRMFLRRYNEITGHSIDARTINCTGCGVIPH